MNKKEFRTLDEQVEILRNKNLIINNEEEVKDILLRENYFFISGYRYLFYNENRKFIQGTTFEELYAAFLFDRNLRNVLFKNLLVVENNIKSIISYQLSKKYGYKEKDYLDPKNFTQDIKESRRVEDVLNKMRRQIRINGEKHTATFHYMTKYKYVPLWILVKVISFGLINELFGILKEEDKEEIARLYNIDKDTLKVYIQLLSNYRNLCAHEDMVYDHRTQTFINDTIYHEKLNLKKDEYDVYTNGKNDLFAIVIIFKQMLQKERFKDFMKEINAAFDIFDNSVDIITVEKLKERMGFPENYMSIINM
ncbi:MAG: Abi family protein [Bacilli bacterium]|nr:Abi family protein [Bacilli bacterium]